MIVLVTHLRCQFFYLLEFHGVRFSFLVYIQFECDLLIVVISTLIYHCSVWWCEAFAVCSVIIIRFCFISSFQSSRCCHFIMNLNEPKMCSSGMILDNLVLKLMWRFRECVVVFFKLAYNNKMHSKEMGQGWR